MPRYLAIELEPSGLSVASANLRGSSVMLEQAVVRPNLGATLSLANAEALGGQLKELLKEAGLRPAPVLLTLNRDRVILKEILHPPTSPSEEPMVVRFQAIKELSDTPGEMLMDYLPLGQANADGEHKALVVFVRKDYITAAKQFCESAGLKLAAVTPRPFAMAAGLRRAIASGQVPALGDPTGAVASVLLNPNGGEFSVSQGSQLLYTRAISGQASRSDVSLVAELKRNLTIYDTQFPKQLIQGIYLPESPTTSGAASWAAFLNEELPVQVHGYDPLTGSPLLDRLPPQEHALLATPVGTLALKAESDSLPINFIQTRQPRAERKQISPRILIGALAAVLVLGLIGTLAIIELNKADELLAERKAQLDELEGQLARLDPDMKRLQAVDEFTKREIVWVDELYDLATRIPDVDKVTVMEVDGNALPPPKKEKARTGLAAATAARAAGTAATGRTPLAKSEPKKESPVASIRISVRTGDPVYASKISDDMASDSFYVGVTKSQPPSQGSGKGDPTYTITSMVLHRGADKYTRKLNAKMPKIESVPPPAEEFDFGFGGGFGEFNP